MATISVEWWLCPGVHRTFLVLFSEENLGLLLGPHFLYIFFPWPNSQDEQNSRIHESCDVYFNFNWKCIKAVQQNICSLKSHIVQISNEMTALRVLKTKCTTVCFSNPENQMKVQLFKHWQQLLLFQSTERSVILQNVIISIPSILSSSISKTVQDADVLDLLLSLWFSLRLALCNHKSTAGFGLKVSVVILDKRMCVRDERRESDRQDLCLFFIIFRCENPLTCSTAQGPCKGQQKDFLNVGVNAWIVSLVTTFTRSYTEEAAKLFHLALNTSIQLKSLYRQTCWSHISQGCY